MIVQNLIIVNFNRLFAKIKPFKKNKIESYPQNWLFA